MIRQGITWYNLETEMETVETKISNKTPRDAGLSPAWHSAFPTLIIASREKLFINSYKAIENHIW